MSDALVGPPGATPLTRQERDGLKQSWITTRSDLNEAERDNVVKGAAWARRLRRRNPASLLDDVFLLELHRRMFGDVWTWAGAYRRSERNLGIEPHRIAVEVRNLLDDARYWVAHDTCPQDEIAVRLHHRLVAIHPFANGNGRHTRLLADLLVQRLGGQPFSWGGSDLVDVGELRRRYIAALRAADKHDIGPLLTFARS